MILPPPDAIQLTLSKASIRQESIGLQTSCERFITNSHLTVI